ncbi:hypothetical protein A2U01_0080727, partial [Trifolium medium]|nr:hypothetical protein [Trifolium medium]
MRFAGRKTEPGEGTVETVKSDGSDEKVMESFVLKLQQ